MMHNTLFESGANELDFLPHTYLRDDAQDTCVIAAQKALGRSGNKRREVYAYLLSRHDGATDEEIQDDLDLPSSTQRPRRKELVDGGLAYDSGERRHTSTGSLAIVWRAKNL